MSLRLKCLIKGEDTVFPVTVEPGAEVSDLKESIQKKRALGSLKDIDPHTLALWKVDIDLDGQTAHSLSQFPIEVDDDNQMLAWRLVSELWQEQPNAARIHIFVKFPPTTATISPSSSNESNVSSAAISGEQGSEPSQLSVPDDKTVLFVALLFPSPCHGFTWHCSSAPTSNHAFHGFKPDAHFQYIHRTFWQPEYGEDIFVKRRVQVPNFWSSGLDENSETLELVVIDLPKGTTDVARLLVVPIYETFWSILQDEDRLWKTCISESESERFTHPCHATIVTGQPGIGKSVFLIYVLLRRLVNGMTTIYCDKKTHVHIFDHTGVRRLNFSESHQHRIPELDGNSECCVLVNLGDKLKSVPQVFYPEHRMSRVVVATSPNEDHLSDFCHEHQARPCYMPTWEWGPLYFASLLYAHKDLTKFDKAHRDALRSTYSVFCGIPRSCFWCLDPAALKIQKAGIKKALDSTTFLDDFDRALKGPLPLNPNTSHRLVRVEPSDAEWLTTRIEIKSNYIAELIFERLRAITGAKFWDQLMEYLTLPYAHGAAGVLFEQAAHYSIRKGLSLTITPLSSGKTEDVLIPRIPVEKDMNSRYSSLSVRERPGSQNVNPYFLDLYMTPQSKSEPSIDALFISSRNVTYLFQMTVSAQHPINFRGLNKIFNELPAAAKKDVRFVFIIPDKTTTGEEYPGIKAVQRIDPPQNANADILNKFKNIQQYTCRLDMDRNGWAMPSSRLL